MKSLFCFFLILTLFSNEIRAQVNYPDSVALCTLFDQTNGSSWKIRTGWKSTAPVRTWYGVKVDPNTNRVVKINLAYNDLSGQLPDQLNGLGALDTLDLSNNLLSGQIPSTLAGLSSLTLLDLSYNYLTFDGLQAIYNLGSRLTFFPQNNLRIIRQNANQIAVSVGSNVTENTYLWYKNGILTTIKPGDNTLYITDSSSYFVKVTNLNFPDTLISEIYVPNADWAFVGIDSTTSPAVKQTWAINSIAFHQTGLAQGVYAGGKLYNSTGTNMLGYWDRVSQDWSLAPAPASTAVVNKLVSASHFGGPGLYSLGRHIDPVTPTFWGGYIANRFGNGWSFMPGADWTGASPDNWEVSGVHIDIASNANTFYALASLKTLDYGTDFFEFDGNNWKPLYLNDWGTSSVDTLNSLLTKALNPNINNVVDIQYWEVVPQRMAVDFAGDVFVAGLAINMTTNQPNKIFAAKWDRGSRLWTLKGLFADFAHSFNQNSTMEQVLQNGVFAIAIPDIGSGDMLIGGNFTDASGSYYVARNNGPADQFQTYAKWTRTNQPLRFNGPVQSIVRGGSDWFVAGDYTNSANQTYVVKIDNLDNADTLGHGPLKAASIKSLTYGERNNTDLYASGIFHDEAERTYFLAHYSPTNCPTVKINVTSEDVLTVRKYTFTAQTFNTGPYPLYTWRKNKATIVGNNSNSLVLTSRQLRDGDSLFCTVIGYSDCSVAPVTDTFVYKTFGVGGLLPVTLVSFDAKRSDDNHIVVNWKTATEKNASHFIVRSSVDGIHFRESGKVAAKNAGGSSYEFIDPDRSMAQQAVTVYYQLEQVDFDGKYTRSQIVPVMPNRQQQEFFVSPVPVSNTLYLRFSTVTKNATVKLIDGVGSLLYNCSLPPGTQNLEIDFSKYSKGVYFIWFNEGENTEVKRLVKAD